MVILFALLGLSDVEKLYSNIEIRVKDNVLYMCITHKL
jgi:hypothetical protein